MVGVCQIFELASTLDPENASHQLFKSTALKGLWSCTFSPVCPPKDLESSDTVSVEFIHLDKWRCSAVL